MTTTQRVSWYEPRSAHTKAYEKHVWLALVNSTVADVSFEEALGYEAVMGMVARRIEAKVDWKKLDKLDVLGVDENALKKGHTDFVTIVTARVDGQLMVLAVLADRTVPENSRILTCRLECSPGSSPSQLKDRQIRHPEQQNADSWAQADFFGPSCSMAS